METSVLVAGANSGIGRATVLHLVELRLQAIGTARTPRGSTPDAIVNNAGYFNAGAVEDVNDEDARRQLETMVVAPMRLARLALPAMRERGWGRIVNVSSASVYGHGPMTGWYQASKSALDALSTALRIETAADGVDVVVIEPARRPRSHYRVGIDGAVLRWTSRVTPAGVRDPDPLPARPLTSARQRTAMPPSTLVDCPVEQVFAVLADPSRYGDFVVGSRHIRDADLGWPAPGSTFHHSLGWGITLIRDQTTVLESDPPTRLVLHTGMGPFGAARTEFRLEPLGARTRVEVEEVPSEGVVAMPGIASLATGMIWVRNKETLRRLRKYS